MWILISLPLLPLLYTIETLSWAVKAAQQEFGLGRSVARTNIMLYGARALNVIFIAIIYIEFEMTSDVKKIASIIFSSMIISLALHIILLQPKILNVSARFVSKILCFPNYNNLQLGTKFFIKSTYWTMWSVVLFAAAIIIPITVAHKFPQYRMSASTLSQIFNALGTVALLLTVEPHLYAAYDDKNLPGQVRPYIIGRIGGFLIATLLAYLLLII